MTLDQNIECIFQVSERYDILLKSYLPLNSGVNCLLFASYCPSVPFYQDFQRISRLVCQVNKTTSEFLRKTRKFLIAEGYSKVWTKGVFSFYGDLRPLAKVAGWGDYGDKGLIVNEKLGTDFLITAVFFY